MKRLQFALEQVYYIARKHSYEFRDMYNVYRVYEKWLNIMKEEQTFYITPNDEICYRTMKGVKGIAKVMFLL